MKRADAQADRSLTPAAPRRYQGFPINPKGSSPRTDLTSVREEPARRSGNPLYGMTQPDHAAFERRLATGKAQRRTAARPVAFGPS